MITIRYATSEDIKIIKEIIKHSILELCKEYYTMNELQSLLAQYPDFQRYQKWLADRVLLVAENDCGRVGFAQYFPDIEYIEAVHVLPGYTNQGIGKQLVEKIEQIARQHGAEKIRLDASLNAEKFYRKCGYEQKQGSVYICNNGMQLPTIAFEKCI